MLTTPLERRRESGFAIVSAIFILVALAALGAFIATVSSTQHAASALDVDGARAYQAARAGVEWGVAQVLVPPNTCNAATNLAAPINGMATSVTCATEASGDGAEAGLGAIYRITATACNQPAAGACPGAAGSPVYVERRVTVLVERQAP